MEEVQHFAENTLVRLSIRVSDEDVHISTRALAPEVWTTRHDHQLCVHTVSCLLHLSLT